MTLPDWPPFSPDTLAERWRCSGEHVRKMIREGELAAFQIGKLYRIPAQEVARVECQTIESSNTAVNTASPSQMASEAAFGSRLVRMTGGSRNLALVSSGDSAPPRPATE